jgi:predicted RNA-binding protein with RPS1 domain
MKNTGSNIAMDKYPIGTFINGTIVSHRHFGAFVDIYDDEVIGLIEIVDFQDEGGKPLTMNDFQEIGSLIRGRVVGHMNSNKPQLLISLQPSVLSSNWEIPSLSE